MKKLVKDKMQAFQQRESSHSNTFTIDHPSRKYFGLENNKKKIFKLHAFFLLSFDENDDREKGLYSYSYIMDDGSIESFVYIFYNKR